MIKAGGATHLRQKKLGPTPKSRGFFKKSTLGTRIHKAEALGIINDLLGDDNGSIQAPFIGVLIGQLTLPLVHEGDALVNLAKGADPDETEVALDDCASNLTEEAFGLERRPWRLPPTRLAHRS